jgi:hypothetical protein
MARDQTQEVFYTPVAVAKFEPTATEAFVELKKVQYLVEQPWEPLLFRLVIPTIEVETAKASATIKFLDETVAGKSQIFQESVIGTEGAAKQAYAWVIERRIVPERDFTEVPTQPGPRVLIVELAASAGKAIIPANTAKKVAYFQILNLARQ